MTLPAMALRPLSGARLRRRCHLDRLARRRNLGSPDAVDRSPLRYSDSYPGSLGFGPDRFPSRPATIPIARHDGQRPASRPRPVSLRFCRIRKRHHPRLRSPQPAPHHPTRRDSKRTAGRQFVTFSAPIRRSWGCRPPHLGTSAPKSGSIPVLPPSAAFPFSASSSTSARSSACLPALSPVSPLPPACFSRCRTTASLATDFHHTHHRHETPRPRHPGHRCRLSPVSP